MYDRIHDLLATRVPTASLSFLGLGILQAWVSVLQTMFQETLNTSAFTAFGRASLYVDMGSLPVFLLIAILARRIAPLGAHGRVLAGSLALMYAGNALIAFAELVPVAPLGTEGLTALPSDTSQLVGLAGLVLAGAGSSLAIICWWELYAVLNPVEVAFCYGMSWIVRELVVTALSGYEGSYLLFSTLVLPLLSLTMLGAAHRRARQLDLPPCPSGGAISFPWKPMALIALYAFTYGCGTWLLRYQDDLSMHLGMVLPAVLVCASVLFASRHFDFAMVYRIILPVAIASILALLLVQEGSEGLVTVLVRASYSSVSLYVSVLLCNLSRRYCISPAWLFSLFNIVHIVFLGAGTLTYNALPSLAVVAVLIVCILFVTFIIVSEPTLNSSWRIVLTRKGTGLGEEARLELTVDSLARKYELSDRQREILLLLAQGDAPRTLANKLGVAPGTVKAHVQHIYKKLGIHSKEELDALVKG